MAPCLQLLVFTLAFAPFQCEGAKAQYKTKTRAGKWQIYNLARANVDLGGEPLK